MRVELGLRAALTTGRVADDPVAVVDPDGGGSTVVRSRVAHGA